jgi:integral membrane protein (TIGR00529 family)
MQIIDFLIGLPAFVKVSLSFAGILAAYRCGIPLGWSILIHSLLLSLWTGAGTQVFLWQAHGFARPENYLLLAAIVLLLFLTEALNATGRMERTVNALKRYLSNHRMLIGGLPALIGLLPMPGGALVSAPLVGSVDSNNEIAPPLKVAINYWFRHIWEYWWPLYPGVIVAIRYCGLPLGIYFVVMTPFTAVAVLSGYFFILRRVPNQMSWKKNGGGERLELRAVSATLGPIGILVGISVLGSIFLPRIGAPAKTANLVAMLAGLCVSLSIVFGGNLKALRTSLRLFRNPQIYSVMFVVVGVLAFSEALKLPVDAAGATLVSLMRDEFISNGVPIIIVIMLLPFISGVVTGLAVGFVGASFPLVFALIGDSPSLNTLIATTVFAYTFGYIGMILSPIHLCFVVTNEYFKTRLFHAYPYLLGPILSILIAALIMSGTFYFLSLNP